MIPYNVPIFLDILGRLEGLLPALLDLLGLIEVLGLLNVRWTTPGSWAT